MLGSKRLISKATAGSLELLRGALLTERGQAANNPATAGGQTGKEQIHSSQIYLRGPILAARATRLQKVPLGFEHFPGFFPILKMVAT